MSMKSDFNEEIPKGSQNNTAGSTRETIIASIICGIILLVPMIYIEYEYEISVELSPLRTNPVYLKYYTFLTR